MKLLRVDHIIHGLQSKDRTENNIAINIQTLQCIHRAHPIVCHGNSIVIYVCIVLHMNVLFIYSEHCQKVAAKVLAACYGFTLQA